jgi:integrase
MHNVITLLRDDYKKKDDTSNVILQIYIRGKRVVLPTGVKIQECFWDDQNKKVTSKHTKSRDYNLIIEQSRALVNDIQIKYRLQDRDITPDLLRAEYNNPSRYLNFAGWMKDEIKDRKGMITASTMIMHYSILKCLENFQKGILFAEIDVKFLERLEKHLKLQEKNSIDTISKKMRVLKLYLNRAKRNQIIKFNPFDSFRIKKGKGRIIYLEEPELRQMIDLYYRELVPRNMKKVLRYFLFSCVTGLRLSDVKRLKFDNIINDTIIIVPQKKMNTDHETVTIPLCKAAKRIILESGPHQVKGKIFESYSDPVTNRYLKDIAKLLKIKKLITFHTSRHTFATLFLEKSNDLATLQKLMGHASIMQTMVYAHVSEIKKREQIKIFDQIFI